MEDLEYDEICAFLSHKNTSDNAQTKKVWPSAITSLPIASANDKIKIKSAKANFRTKCKNYVLDNTVLKRKCSQKVGNSAVVVKKVVVKKSDLSQQARIWQDEHVVNHRGWKITQTNISKKYHFPGLTKWVVKTAFEVNLCFLFLRNRSALTATF